MSKVASVSKEPALTGSAPLENLVFESFLVGLTVRRCCAMPGRHVCSRWPVRRASLTSAGGWSVTLGAMLLCLKGGALWSSCVPLLGDDENPIVILRFLEECFVGKLQIIESGVGDEGLQIELEIGDGAGFENVVDDCVDVGRNHIHHLEPNEG